MTKKGEQKLRAVQRLFADGFDLTEGSIAPFLVSPNDDEKPQRGSKIIDRVQDGIVTFEDGSVESVSLLKNPYNIPLEGAEYRDGQIFPGQRGGNRDLLNKIKARGSTITPEMLKETPVSGEMIIDRVQGGLVTFEDGSVESSSLIRNPNNIPLEGSLYRDGEVFPATEQRARSEKLLNKIKAKNAPPVMPMEGTKYLRQNDSWRVDDYTKDEFFSKWPMDKIVGFLYDRGEKFDDRPAWSKDLDNKKLDEIRSLGNTPKARKALQEYVSPFLPEKHPWE